MSGLRALADEYDRQRLSPWASSRRRRDLDREAAFLRRVVCNREAADPARLNLARAQFFGVIEHWCSRHGYRCAFGVNGLTLQRREEPAIVAGPYDTLRWDDERITVEPWPARLA